ncbi:MAG: hypothetical protein FJZ96_15725 [Chloroflexi bacterium]|nr:hypothetical protein [Chloroflexota bacterium]
MSRKPASKPKTYIRFSIAQRIEHLVMLLTFTTLGLTGLPQKFPLSGISLFLVDLLGGIETVRAIHHTAAIVMMFGAIYHLLMMGYMIFVRRVRMTMLPTLQDVKDGWQALLYNIGLSKTYPQMGRYTFEEKMEYWAFVWGTVIMGLSGFMMWNPVTTARFLPGEVIPAAKAAHGGEALLAALAIIIWHMYGVHIKRFNKAMWTGRQTEAEMLHEHPLELADIKAGVAGDRLDPKSLRMRQMAYIPIAALLAGVMLFGVYGFVFSEETAVDTVPPAASEVPVYLPQTPTPLPQQAVDRPLTWDGGLAPLLEAKCGLCHGPGSTTGLSFDTYVNALAAGGNGPAIIPGDPGNSPLVTLQVAGGHPGQLTAEELAFIQEWIEAGAPEK